MEGESKEMRYDIKSLNDLREFVEEMDDEDRIAIYADGKIYVFRVYSHTIQLREIQEIKK